MSGVTNGSDKGYSYTYDKNGNILSITQDGTSATYVYDRANQLIHENNGFTNETVTYAYDEWGNIRKVQYYPYTTDSVLFSISDERRIYRNRVW